MPAFFWIIPALSTRNSAPIEHGALREHHDESHCRKEQDVAAWPREPYYLLLPVVAIGSNAESASKSRKALGVGSFSSRRS
jgi:hypothetical protein